MIKCNDITKIADITLRGNNKVIASLNLAKSSGPLPRRLKKKETTSFTLKRHLSNILLQRKLFKKLHHLQNSRKNKTQKSRIKNATILRKEKKRKYLEKEQPRKNVNLQKMDIIVFGNLRI